MDVILIISIYVILISIASLPCLLVCLVAEKLLPSRFSVKPKILTSISVLLSLLSAYLLNMELEGGMLSVLFVAIVLTLAWFLVLLVLLVLYKSVVKTKSA